MNKEWSLMSDLPMPGANARGPLFTRTRGRAVAAAILIVVAGAGVVLFAWRGSGKPPAPQVGPALTVTTTRPQQVIWPQMLSASGVIAPWQEASIGPQIGSYQLVEVRANIGDRVQRGQVLARLNPALLRAEAAQLQARYDQATANGRRALDLKASGGVSEQDVLAAETETKTAAALLAAKRLELRYTAILAPDDGVITARTATLGAVAPAGQELFRMIRQNRLEWRGELTAGQLRAVAAGQAVTLSLPDGGQASALVRQAAPAMDDQSRLGLVYADIAQGGRARAGMYVTGAITIGKSRALTVPAQCVVVRDGRSYVMLLEGRDPASVRLRAVKPGRRNEDVIEILDGLTGGERLVFSGAGFLNDGDVVRVAHAQGGH